MVKNMRVAVCGELPTACDFLKSEGIVRIDSYFDSLDLAFNLRNGEDYHLILVYAPQGEGLMDASYSYRKHLDGEWQTIPVRMLNEPACRVALGELKATVNMLAKQMRENVQIE